MKRRTDSFSALTFTWLTLVGLTFASLLLGKWSAAAPWLPLLMAAVIWAKCSLIADRFIESNQAIPFIRWAVQVFIALSPLALLLIAFFGDEISRWSAL